MKNALGFVAVLALCLLPASSRAQSKPVLLYSRCFNAPGENRYAPEGPYGKVLEALGKDFAVETDDRPLTAERLTKAKVLLLANVSAGAFGTNPAPHHVSDNDVKQLTSFVRGGGGLIFLSNQPEGHNLDVTNSNKLLGQFGIQQTNLVTDAKKLELPASTPLVGGLRWAYYTGNLLLLDPKNSCKPEAVVMNDLGQKPVKGPRDQTGVLLARATPGKGRVVVITDAGSIANFAFSEEGVGGVAIKGQDNLEMFLRLARWAAGK